VVWGAGLRPHLHPDVVLNMISCKSIGHGPSEIYARSLINRVISRAVFGSSAIKSTSSAKNDRRSRVVATVEVREKPGQGKPSQAQFYMHVSGRSRRSQPPGAGSLRNRLDCSEMQSDTWKPADVRLSVTSGARHSHLPGLFLSE